MLVKLKYNKDGLKDGLSNDTVYSVYREDSQHFYVRNDIGMIEGYDKNSFVKIPKREEREFKLNRILNENSVKEPKKELFDYDIDDLKITVEWTGSYPNLCSGNWIIRLNQMQLPIPEHRIGNDMGTCGEYSRCYFTEGWSEEWDIYFDEDDGEWIKDDNWLNYSLVCLAEYYNLNFVGDMKKLKQKIYDEISNKDWRSGSCGGCI